MDVTMKLRAACGHDSRSVDGCTNCEAADEIERLRRAVLGERERCARICDEKHDTWRWDDGDASISGPRECAAAIRSGRDLCPHEAAVNYWRLHGAGA